MKRCKQVHKFRYLVMTRACVLLSILLANSRAWPQSPPFMAASSASYSIDEVEHVFIRQTQLNTFSVLQLKRGLRYLPSCGQIAVAP